MQTQKHRPRSVPGFVDRLQATGRYTFRRDEVGAETGTSPIAVAHALKRLADKGRIVTPRRGFHVIVPLEYTSTGSPPASWFIDDLMRYLERPYYVGLLTAAALHGASHQSPQEFQVVTTEPLRPVQLGRLRIHFFTKRHGEKTPFVERKTETGKMRLSSPDVTALDLVRYLGSVGHLDNVATVLSELAEKLTPTGLLNAAKTATEFSHAQRLAYLLHVVGQRRLAKVLQSWLEETKPRAVPLHPGRPVVGCETDPRWQVIVNESVETEA